MYFKLVLVVGGLLFASTFCYSQESYVQDTIVVIDTLVVYDTVTVSNKPIIVENKLEEKDSVSIYSTAKNEDKIAFFDDISILAADYQAIGVETHIRYKSYYLLLTAGTNFNLATPLIGGIGVGKKVELSSTIYLTPEIVSMWYFPFGRDYPPQNNSHIRLGVAYQLSPKLAIKITPSVYCAWRNNVAGNKEYNEISHIISPLIPFYATETSSNSTFDIGAGGSIQFIYHIR